MKINLGAALLAFILIGAGCTKNGSLTSKDASSVSGSIAVTTVYPTAEGESWTAIKSSSRYYIKGLDLTIKGNCSRGVAAIKVGEAGVGGAYYTETATCLNDGSFTWNKSFSGPLDADKTITLVAFDINDLVISGADAAADVHVDNVAPTAPVVTTPASSPYTYNGATTTFNIAGTVSADTDHVTGPSSVVVPVSGAAWNHDVTLVPASSLDFTYYAWDLAGNQSVGFTQSIQWTPSLSLAVSGAIPGDMVTDSGSLFSIEGSADHNEGQSTDATSLFKFDFGFNFITNSARQ